MSRLGGSGRVLGGAGRASDFVGGVGLRDLELSLLQELALWALLAKILQSCQEVIYSCMSEA